MADVLTYKGFVGSVHFSADDSVFHGKIEGIDDLVTFEGASVEELTAGFKGAVEDYLQLCKRTGKQVEKSYRGTFNVRVPPELHRMAAWQSTLRGISLNQLVQRALEAELSAGKAKHK